MMHGDNKFEHPISVLFDVGDARRIVGQFKLKRGELFDSNVVSITDDDFFHIDDGGCLHGVSEAGRVSLLNCVTGGPLGSTHWEKFAIHHGDVSFRYALFGKRHVTADERCIRGIQFTLEGVDSSVFMHDKFERFGHIPDPHPEILDAIRRRRPDHLKGDFVQGQAMVSYFTGDWDALSKFETVLGNVRVGRSMLVDFFGTSMKNALPVSVDFDDDPTTLERAWEKMREIRQFFAWMMGYAPAWKEVFVFTSRQNEAGLRADPDGMFELFGPNEWKEVPEDARRYGTLIDASRNPGHFADVMTNWLERNANANRRNANTRFFGCLWGASGRVLEDAIVSAANTFDLLPNEDKPDAQALSGDVPDILNDATTKIKDTMAAGTQKEDVLNALGRIRTNKRLRDIVEHRARVVLDHFGEETLKSLNDVIRLAVLCRNYYTHGADSGPAGNVDFSDPNVAIFLTKTLEFVYGASELLLCGWDPAKSVSDEWHPLGGYVKFYDYNRSVVLEQK